MKTEKTEYLFRGKRTDNDEWVYGYLSKMNDGIIISTVIVDFDNSVFYRVIPKTVSQFSGILDKNKKKIFDGDLFKLGAEPGLFEVGFEHGCFLAYKNGKQFGIIGELQICFIEVIGNIFDNIDAGGDK